MLLERVIDTYGTRTFLDGILDARVIWLMKRICFQAVGTTLRHSSFCGLPYNAVTHSVCLFWCITDVFFRGNYLLYTCALLETCMNDSVSSNSAEVICFAYSEFRDGDKRARAHEVPFSLSRKCNLIYISIGTYKIVQALDIDSFT